MDRRVAIVGAGLAGLAAARSLRAAGASVVVLEREAEAGGRARSEHHEGFWLDAGPHLLGACDREVLSLAADAGLAGELLPLRPLARAQLHRGVLRPLAGDDFQGAGRAPGMRRHQAWRLRRLARLLRRFGDLLDPAAPETAVRLDDRSVADFARLYFGRSVLERWAEPWIASELLADPEEASRVLLMLHLVARGAGVGGVLRAGTGALAQALCDAREDRLAARVERVEPRGEGVVLHVVTSTGAEVLEADAALLATPAEAALAVAGDWISTPERAFLAAARTVPAIVLVAALDRSPTRHGLHVRVPRVEGWPLASALLEPGGAAARAPEGTGLATLVASPDWSRAHLDAPDDAVEKVLLGCLQRLFPGAPASVRFVRILRQRAALPRFDVGRVRELARFRRVQADQRARGRRLHFAGDHLVAPTLEGAAASGRRAGRELAEDLGLAVGREPAAG